MGNSLHSCVFAVFVEATASLDRLCVRVCMHVCVWEDAPHSLSLNGL